jgi:hypothetical protein
VAAGTDGCNGERDRCARGEDRRMTSLADEFEALRIQRNPEKLRHLAVS